MLVSDFLTNLKRRGQLQAYQTVLSDSDLVSFANDEMRMVICPKILSVRERYFQGVKQYALSSSTYRYRLPARILGGRVFSIKVDDGNPNNIRVLNQVNPNARLTEGFYIEDGDIVLTGNQPPNSGTMYVFYPVRPPAMSSSAVAIGTVSTVGASSLTANTSLNSTYEIIRQQSPFRTISPNVTFASSTTGTDNDCTDYTRYQASDIIIVADSTHIVPLNEELVDWLLERTLQRYLYSVANYDEAAALNQKILDMERDGLALINPRVADESKVVNGMEVLGWRNW